MASVYSAREFKKLRRKSKLTLESVASRLQSAGINVSYGTVRNWEIGRTVPDANDVRTLAGIFNCTVDAFFVEKKRKAKTIAASVAILLFFAAPAFAAVDIPATMNVIIAAESSGRANAIGDEGKARGLCQIQRATWERYTTESWDRAFDPALNRAVGERIVRDLVKRYGSRATQALVVYSYNTGRFVKPGKQLPAWTKKHPNKIYRGVFNARA